MITFWVLWGFDALVSLVFLYYFLIGVADGSVSSFNIGIWLLLLAIITAILLGSMWLKNHQHLFAAKGVLCIMAIPGAIAALFLLIMLISNPRWN
ncbi:MAG: osmoprotectant transporter permease [Spirosomataceae bacterium]